MKNLQGCSFATALLHVFIQQGEKYVLGQGKNQSKTLKQIKTKKLVYPNLVQKGNRKKYNTESRRRALKQMKQADTKILFQLQRLFDGMKVKVELTFYSYTDKLLHCTNKSMRNDYFFC